MAYRASAWYPGKGRQMVRTTGFVGARHTRGNYVARRSAAVAVARARSGSNARTGGYTGMERKFIDFNVAADTFTTVWAGGEMEDGTALSLTATAIGDTESTRDGRVYYINSVHVKGFIINPQTESQTGPLGDQLARLAMVWDTQTNGAQLNAEDVFLTIGGIEDVNSFRNLQNSHRFIVLKDKTFRVGMNSMINEGAINLFGNGIIRIPFKMNKTFKKPIKVRCTGTTAAVGSISDNSIHLIGCASSASLQLTYQSRCRFTA